MKLDPFGLGCVKTEPCNFAAAFFAQLLPEAQEVQGLDKKLMISRGRHADGQKLSLFRLYTLKPYRHVMWKYGASH